MDCNIDNDNYCKVHEVQGYVTTGTDGIKNCEDGLLNIKMSIDEATSRWLSAHGIKEDVQNNLDYSTYDDGLEQLLNEAKEQ